MTTAPNHASPLAQDVAAFCRQQVPDTQQRRESFPSSALWSSVAATGTSLWLDTGDIDAARINVAAPASVPIVCDPLALAATRDTLRPAPSEEYSEERLYSSVAVSGFSDIHAA